jgi:hypothetical protein
MFVRRRKHIYVSLRPVLGIALLSDPKIVLGQMIRSEPAGLSQTRNELLM